MLDASSTFKEIHDEYMNCADYDIMRNLDKARRFVVACRFMLNPLFIQDEHRHAGESSRIEFARIQKQLDSALLFVTENDDSLGGSETQPIFSDFSTYRD